MAIGDDNVVWGPPRVVEAELNHVFAEGEVVYVRGLVQLRLGDGSTVGGIIVGSGGGGGGGESISFATIAVEGVDAGQWITADQLSDVLTFRALRGLVITPIPGSDILAIGFPDGGAFGNGLYWTGTTFAPNPPPAPVLEFQEGQISTDILAEGIKKLGDGSYPLILRPSPTTPCTVVEYNNIQFLLCGPDASSLAIAMDRVPDVTYTTAKVAIRWRATSTGDLRFSVRVGEVTDVTAALSYSTNVTLATVTIPVANTQYETELTLQDLPSAGKLFVMELGRLGAIGADTATGDMLIIDARLELI